MRRTQMALAVLMLVAAGCGSGTSLVPVSGRVTLEGKPLAFKSVRFIPEAGTPGQGAGANTDADGRYTLLAVQPGSTRDVKGVAAGAYRVVVSEPMFPIDTPMPESTGDEPAPAIGLPEARPRKKQQTIPLVYTSPERTTLRVEVPAEGGTVDLALKLRP